MKARISFRIGVSYKERCDILNEVKNKTYLRSELEDMDDNFEMIPLTYDFSFKKVFGGNLKILKKFVIDVLKLDEIVDPNDCNIELVSNELPKENRKEYKKTVDIYVVLNKMIHIDVEVNTEFFSDIKLRNLMFADKANSLLLEKGDHYRLLNKKYLYQLNLNVAEKQILVGEDIVVPYGLNTKRIYNENKKIVIKYLAYYRNLFYNKNTKRKEDIWLAALTAEKFTELYDILSYILAPEDRDVFIKDVVSMSKDFFSLHEWEKEKLDALVEDEKRKRIEKEGLEKGFEKGIEQGIEQEKLEIAKNMINMNIDLKTISQATGLKSEEIEKLK